MNKDSKMLAEAYEKASLGSDRALLRASFDKDKWSPLVKALEKASWSGGGNDKQIAIANIASNLFNLLAGKEGVVEPEEKAVLERVGQEILKLAI